LYPRLAESAFVKSIRSRLRAIGENTAFHAMT
jgi:hypothetical protein